MKRKYPSIVLVYNMVFDEDLYVARFARAFLIPKDIITNLVSNSHDLNEMIDMVSFDLNVNKNLAKDRLIDLGLDKKI